MTITPVLVTACVLSAKNYNAHINYWNLQQQATLTWRCGMFPCLLSEWLDKQLSQQPQPRMAINSSPHHQHEVALERDLSSY